MNEDPTEQVDLSDSHPEKLRQLRATLYALDNQMAEPLWPALVENSIPIGYTIDKIPDEAHGTIIWSN